MSGTLLDSEATLHLRIGCQQIGQALYLNQVKLAMLKGTARELASLSHSAVIERSQFLQNCADQGSPTVKMQLQTIFSGKGARSGEPQDQSLVQK